MGKYIITSIKVYQEPWSGVTVVFEYTDWSQIKCVSVNLAHDIIVNLDKYDMLAHAAEIAVKHVGDPDFMNAVAVYATQKGFGSSIGGPPGPAEHKKNPSPVSYTKVEFDENIDTTKIDELPGLKEQVVHPVTKVKVALKTAIISLNDKHGWTREQVADWLETLDIDLRFKSPDVKLKESQLKNLTTKMTVASEHLKVLQQSVIEAKAQISKLQEEIDKLKEEM